jgi:hypothetical protein
MSYKLIIHECSEADFREKNIIFFLQIFLQFLFYSVKHPDGLLLRLDGHYTGLNIAFQP